MLTACQSVLQAFEMFQWTTILFKETINTILKVIGLLFYNILLSVSKPLISLLYSISALGILVQVMVLLRLVV